MSLVLLADWTAPTGAVGSAIAAVAALVAIGYARRAVEAANRAIGEERKLRVEEDFREFGRVLWDLHQAADDARAIPGETVTSKMRHAQTRLRSVLVTPIRVSLAEGSTEILDKTLSRYSDAATVYSGAAHLIEAIQDSWDEWEAKEHGQAHARRPLD